MRGHSLELDMILRAIVMTRGETGATIGEMRSDYYHIKEEPWPLQFQPTNRIIDYLHHIDGLIMERARDGLCVWYIDDLGNLSHQLQDYNNNDSGQSNKNIVTVNSSGESALIIDQSRSEGSSNFLSRSLSKSKSTNASTESGVRFVSTTTDNNNNSRANSNKMKRTTVDHAPATIINKRPRLEKLIPLSKVNLSLHDKCTRVESVVAMKTTSTEVETASSRNASLNLQSSLNEINSQEFRSEFEKQCHSNGHVQKHLLTSPSLAELNLFFQSRILGDDFMLSLINFTMFDAEQSCRDKRAVFCESGQTIGKVFKKIVDSHYLFTTNSKIVIVNLGALDILLNRNLTDIQAEYMRLINAMKKIGLIPIITTVPMVKLKRQHPNKKLIKQTVLLFNAFLHETYSAGYFIDLWHSFHQREDDLCQVEPKIIKIDRVQLEIYLWNKLGRYRVVRSVSNYLNSLQEM